MTGEELYNALDTSTREHGFRGIELWDDLNTHDQAIWSTLARWVEQECEQRFADGMMSEKRATVRQAAEAEARRKTEGDDAV